MKSRVLVLVMAAATLMALLSTCGSDGATTVTTANTSAETTAESSATEKRIEKVEQETEEAELEAAEAKKEAAQQAAKVKEAAARRAAAAKAEAAQATQENEESTSEPPDVVGMKLPEAKAELQSAGFHTVAVNTDTVFGIVVPSHYTVCEETPLGGNNVKVLAQKYGC